MDNISFILRGVQKSDFGSLAKYANNQKIAKFLTDKFPYPYTENDAKAFIERTLKNQQNIIFAIEVNSEFAGAIGVHPQDDIHRFNAEMGYWLAEPYWGNGIMSKAIEQIVKYTFENSDIERIFARPFSNNIASQKVLIKNNFKLEARFEKAIVKNGKILDELIFAIRRNNPES